MKRNFVMKNLTFILIGISVGLYLVLPFTQPAQAQDYKVSRYAINDGGGTSSAGPYVLIGIIGQPEAGWAIGGKYELLGGFWPGSLIHHPPVADAGGPYYGVSGIPITFDANGSYDPDGVIVLYEWDWDSDGIYDDSSSDPMFEYTWFAEFSGTIRLRVTDNDGLISSIDTALVAVETSHPEPVDDLVSISLGRVGYNRRTGQFSVNVTVTNTSAEVIGKPVWLVIENITNPAVTLANPDGTTMDGKPYIDLTQLLGDGQLGPGGTVSKRIYFNNPSRARFNFSSTVHSVILP